jgi:hypothetical protein
LLARIAKRMSIGNAPWHKIDHPQLSGFGPSRKVKRGFA